MILKRLLPHLVYLSLILIDGHAVGAPGLGATFNIVLDHQVEGSFPIVYSGQVTPILVDQADHVGVQRASDDLQADIERVTGVRPVLMTDFKKAPERAIVTGTVGKSRLIDHLIQSGKIDISGIEGEWESFMIVTVSNPFQGMDEALVIVGSDKRGTIYGIYELSEQMGVSPWYWWADVPVDTKSEVFVRNGVYEQESPKVKYRGIFLNDEYPALTRWADKEFGGYNHEFYSQVFELLLRLRGNYVWPAMWGSAFNVDDPENPALADEYGIVMGTSHHEPMMRAHAEWKDKTMGAWDYSKNESQLREFWKGGIERNKDYESIVTIGMRGDGDEPMSDDANTELLESVVKDQREILTEVYDRSADEIPQIWALYKEVQDYYEKGMRVPDDVTLLWCDDNWGNIRRLPTETERTRAGGAGVYYHFDYVGGPRSYRWINTNPLPKIQEQMNLAYEYGANQIWIVNVGDLKPMEVPMEFFLRMAWDPERYPTDKVQDYLVSWANREFGQSLGPEIAELMAGYAKFNGRRKPELLGPEVFSWNHREFERVIADWQELLDRAEQVASALPLEAKDAYYQLILHPIQASCNLNKLYYATALNHLYADQNRLSTNEMAEQVRVLFQKDADIQTYWDEDLADGKWKHFMDQTHIGYTSWNSPKENNMPELADYEAPDSVIRSSLGVTVEGSPDVLTSETPGVLPLLSSEGGRGSSRIELFRRRDRQLTYRIESDQPWVTLSSAGGDLLEDIQVEVSLDWNRVPVGSGEVLLQVSEMSEGNSFNVKLPYSHPKKSSEATIEGYLDIDGYVSIEAPHFDRAINESEINWKVLPDYGNSLGGVTSFPVDAETRLPQVESARLEYNVHLKRAGEIPVHIVTSPTLNFMPDRGLRFAVSFDDGEPQIIDLVTDANYGWDDAVRNNSWKATVYLPTKTPGLHVLKLWRVDPGVVFQHIEIDTGGALSTYLGAPESPRGLRVSNLALSGFEQAVLIQSEDGILGEDILVSSGLPQYISAKSDGGGSSPAAVGRVASYNVEFPSPGKYRLFARVRVGAGNFRDDSMFFAKDFGVRNPSNSSDWIMLNGLAEIGYSDPSEVVTPNDSTGRTGVGAWKWVDLTELGKHVGFVVPEGQTSQVFQVAVREDGLDIDRFLFGEWDNYFTVSNLNWSEKGSKPE